MITFPQKDIKKIPQITWELALAFFFCLTSLVILSFFWSRLPPQVPLFYSHPWGEEQLAAPVFLFLLPGGAFLIFLVNLVLASLLAEERLILRILVVTSVLCAFLGLFVLIKILKLSL